MTTTTPARRNAGDEMLTIQETCEFLRVPEDTLRYWRHLGCGPLQLPRSAATSATGTPTSPSGPGAGDSSTGSAVTQARSARGSHRGAIGEGD